MKLFNTLTQSLEEFVPIDEKSVRIYVCGVTPYDTTHLGHAFTYVSFDTLIRYLEFRGYKVKYVQNVTDIDDDVLRMARAIGLNDYSAMLTIANERGNYPDDPHKKDPLDFVLWQAQAPGEPAWPSPWGPGRPGWHIECSSIVMHYLGPQIDIHGGGVDLAFPHHTCEITQSEHYTGKSPFSRFWVHTGMVYQDGEKMSKSLGNLTLVSDLLKEYSADAIRLTLLSHHYRHPWECFSEDLHSATRT